MLHLSLVTSGYAAPREDRAGYDGKTLFRGLFFGTGPAAKEFRELWDRADVRQMLLQTRGMEGQVEATRQMLINKLSEQNPAFFDTFAEEVQSGDHLRVQAALQDAVTRLHGIAMQELALNGTPVTALSDDFTVTAAEGDCLAIGVVVVVVFAIAIAIVIAVAVAVVLWGFLWVVPMDLVQMGVPGSSLRGDMVVDLLATRLDRGRAEQK